MLASTVLRARQTAEGLARELRLGPIVQDCDLCELHPGAADGMSWEDYHATYGTFDLIEEPDRPFADGAECWLEFLGRVQATFDRLAARFDGQTVIAVTHAGFIVAASWYCSRSRAPVPAHGWILPTLRLRSGSSRRRHGDSYDTMTKRMCYNNN